MSGRFGFPVFTVALLLIGGIVRLLEVNGMTPFGIPWLPIIVIIAAVLLAGALIFGRNRDRPGFCPFSAICPFNNFCPFGHER
ncbi:MAG: hypothetical protein U9N36_10950 [Euryarchaeota archaeon]|nr:hypothetical protein [Euryarchaeota archaeon]